MQLIPRNDSRSAASAGAAGFTLIEVLVALIITAIGLLGIAKIEALAFANTGSASTRSLVAIQAASLASAMHANRVYWSLGSAPSPFTITGTTAGAAVISDATLNGAATGLTDCNFGGALAPCTPANLAAFDLHTWGNAMDVLLPGSNPVTTITCPPGSIPLNCTISITWNEKTVSMNAQSAANTTTATFAPTYVLYVEP
ncbi:MAG TPA: type IV pilus modification protein PilV [Steroidobacteraceae bacterium]|jgi:type IV pilus assembly protein PilV|nr:type IV pilus modification protein PilV [Steroidobacteraceae bacterium]